MKVSELIKLLQNMPQNIEVEVNDNDGSIFEIDQVDFFEASTKYKEPAVVMLQCNV